MQKSGYSRRRLAILSSALLFTLMYATGASQAQKFKDGQLVVNIQSQIGTAYSKAGDTFTASVIEPAALAGAIVEGKIAKVTPAKAGGDKSHIVFAFSTITMPDNATYKMEAPVRNVVNAKGVAKVDEEGQLVGLSNSNKKTLYRLGGMGAGMLLGGIAGNVVDIAAGAGAGLLAGWVISVEVVAPGPNMDFGAGTHFTLDAKNVGRDKDVNADDVRAESQAEVDKSAQVVPPAATPDQPAPVAAAPAASSAPTAPAITSATPPPADALASPK